MEQGNGGLRADLHFNPKHALAEQLMWDAEHAPENVGFSHNVEARTSHKEGKTIVEEIIRVQSVDLVADPATTRGLFEHHENQERKENIVEFTELTEAELRAYRPDLAKAIADCALAEHANSETEKARASELAALKEEVKSLKAEKAKADLLVAVNAELAEAKLPPAVVTDLFRTQLIEAANPGVRKALIEDRRKIAGAAGGAQPQSKEQQVAEGGTRAYANVTDGKSFVAAITN
jgi:hypothetical protein